jgi:hypothetical protein
MMVGDNLYGDLNLEKAVKILEDEKRMIMEKKKPERETDS